MRLATITNWAYGATVVFTLVSGVTMLLASSAHERERAAVQQRYLLDSATAELGNEIYAMTEHARQFAVSGDPTYEVLHARDAKLLGSIEQRIADVRDAGADRAELRSLAEAIRWADTLREEQDEAIAARRRGDSARAYALLFGPEYERELQRSEDLLAQFRAQLDRRTAEAVDDATAIARVWTGISQGVLALTALLFLGVLFFVFKQRVLRPVVKLSDVVNRLAAQDYGVDLPDVGQIDEIGDITQALKVFRENGLERQQLEAERSADANMRDLLSRMTQRMQGCEDLGGLMDVISCFMPEIAPDRSGAIYLLDENRNAMVRIAAWRDPALCSPEFSPLACWALRRGDLHRPSIHAIDVPCEHLAGRPDEPRDTVCVPLTAQREMLGLLYLESRGPAGEATTLPAVYLKLLGENVSLALGNLKLREALREMAMADPLTGLANRRRLEEAFDAEARLAERVGTPLTVLMIDVDHFKQFNDRFGHDAGDFVLREVGGVLKRMTRGGDHAFRYGGEEFLLLLPGMQPGRAVERAEKIRESVSALRLRHGTTELGPVHVSIGVASAPESGTYDDLVQLADGALYRAKRNGRDRVEVADAETDKPAAAVR